MIKVIMNGAMGRMGKEIVKSIEESDDVEIAALIDINGDGKDVLRAIDDFTGDADVIIDFSHHTAVHSVLDYAKKRNIPAVVATTGMTEEELKYIDECAEIIPVFRSANMSIGVAVLAAFAAEAARVIPDADIEIVETHHRNKLDAPSGTALLIANEIKTSRPEAEFVCGNEKARGQRNRYKFHSLRQCCRNTRGDNLHRRRNDNTETRSA